MKKNFISILMGLSLIFVLLSGAVLAQTGTEPQAADSYPVAVSTPAYWVNLPVVDKQYCRLDLYADPYWFYQADMTKINADDAWVNCAMGSHSVVVAVIDTGVDLDHPDLAANLIPGFDFVDNDPVPEDGQGHGTNVAGIVGAPLNGIGVIGTAPKTAILPVRVLNNSGSGSFSTIVNGILWAADRANILNLSLGGKADSQLMRDAINYAADTRGRLVVVSAGNCGDSNYPYNNCDYQDQTLYPAAYPNSFAVAATDNADYQASFSNQGSYVDIAAPGVNIYSTYYGNSYYTLSGTSQAAPHVAGLAALIKARRYAYTSAQIRTVIETTSKDLGTVGPDIAFGKGRIDAYAATQYLGKSTYTVEDAPVGALPALTEPAIYADIPHVAGRVVVGLQPDAKLETILTEVGIKASVQVVGEIKELNVVILQFPEGSEVDYAYALSAAKSGVRYAELDYLAFLIE